MRARKRWGRVRIFTSRFKARKPSRKVKTFEGTSESAIQTEIWTVLVGYLQLRSTFGWSLSNLVALLRQQLLVNRDLMRRPAGPFQGAADSGRRA